MTFAMVSMCVSLLSSLAVADASGPAREFRPPAVPLVTHDPYLSVWSMSDKLTDDWTRHWTGSVQAMCGMARIDGKPYRFAGKEPGDAPPMTQVSVQVLPTQTRYQFEAGGVRLRIVFCSPLLPQDPDMLGRPVTYVFFETNSIDGKPHDVALYFDCTAEWAINLPEQPVVWGRSTVGNIDVLHFAAKDQEQNLLKKTGDRIRIDWGTFYLAVPKQGETVTRIANDTDARRGFAASGALPDRDDEAMPRPANDHWPVLACVLNLGEVKEHHASERVLMLAYDDEYSIELMGKRLRPYWRRGGMNAPGLLKAAADDFDLTMRRCAIFDQELMEDLVRAGGAKYAALCALAFREALAGQKLVAAEDGTPLMFPKENSSNGCISTVDVIYPACPFYLLFNAALLKAQLKPVMDYAQSPRWPWPFAPHDLGTYPLADGQVYGGGEKTEKNQMPVEESANMLLMLAALTRIEGNAEFVAQYWPTVTKWAEYLRDKGLDPENQLCTDDFAGHLAHNANLSIKAILALGAYAQLCERTGKAEAAAQYRALAKGMAEKWVGMADDGDHFRLAFDKPGTWSQKYNLVWDRLLGLGLFPGAVAEREIAYYKTVQKHYGLPLDNRKNYTKLDWLIWTATLAGSPSDFEALVAPAYAFAHDTPDRVALTDWYDTVSCKNSGFTARPVMGGLFIKMLADDAMWKKWSARPQAAR
jgi:hypothetical protein